MLILAAYDASSGSRCSLFASVTLEDVTLRRIMHTAQGELLRIVWNTLIEIRNRRLRLNSKDFEHTIIIGASRWPAVAVTVSLWDHIIRFGQEFELLWRQRKTLYTMLLMFDMYGVEGSMIYFAFVFSGVKRPLSDTSTLYGNIRDDQHRRLSILTTAFVVLFVFQADRGNIFHLSVPHSWKLTVASDGITYSAAVDSCVLGNSTYLTGVLGGMALFDLYVIILLVVSTLSRPRRNDAEIVNNLKRDGFLAFLDVAGLRLIPFIQNMLENASQTFTSLFVAIARGIRIFMIPNNCSTIPHHFHFLEFRRTIWNAGRLPISGESMNETLQKCVSRFDAERGHTVKPDRETVTALLDRQTACSGWKWRGKIVKDRCYILRERCSAKLCVYLPRMMVIFILVDVVSESRLSRALVAGCRVINRAVAKLPEGGKSERLLCVVSPGDSVPPVSQHLSDLTMATDIETLAGGYFIEVLLAIMLYGVAITQAYAYWWDYPNDSKRLRWTIVILIFAAMYEYLIIDFNDIDKIQTIVWYVALSVVLAILNTAIVQGFLIRRIWIRHLARISSVFKLGSWKLYRDTKMTTDRIIKWIQMFVSLATVITAKCSSTLEKSPEAQGTQASQIEILTMVSKVTDNMLYHEHGVPKPPVSSIVIEPSKNQILKDDD
ncbi:hypothetical protein IEO21_04082 [Rhodonia placenta]|uniref:Uncharacterized protein n=1 Tax=Rhodonia placenta TaxID=104341 RepID=A0A8H7P4Q7_9APHY|nr:hypothetical protein IEO21_04082 [Postia placenta]